VIAPYGAEEIDPLAGSTSRDDVVYRVVVAILAADNGDQEAHFNQYPLAWRESIRRLFHDQPLGSLCFSVQVQPLEVVDRDAWQQRNLFASGLVLKCFSREPRG